MEDEQTQPSPTSVTKPIVPAPAKPYVDKAVIAQREAAQKELLELGEVIGYPRVETSVVTLNEGMDTWKEFADNSYLAYMEVVIKIAKKMMKKRSA